MVDWLDAVRLRFSSVSTGALGGSRVPKQYSSWGALKRPDVSPEDLPDLWPL